MNETNQENLKLDSFHKELLGQEVLKSAVFIFEKPYVVCKPFCVNQPALPC